MYGNGNVDEKYTHAKMYNLYYKTFQKQKQMFQHLQNFSEDLKYINLLHYDIILSTKTVHNS